MPGLYIHIPFCAHACPYCDFSFELLRTGLVDRFLSAFSIELERKTAILPWRDTVFDTVFIGGGTPTCLSTGQLTRFFETLQAHARVHKDTEISIEANPETLTDTKLAALRDFGVNRLSLGVQSFQKASLHSLGRHHTVERAVHAVSQVREAGFANLNIDLIFGAPAQTFEDWTDSLEAAIALNPEHISAYGLTIEDNTPFGRQVASGHLILPPEESALAMYNRTIDRLTEGGYRHYEISNFSKPATACRHNLLYWSGGDYLGLGPSAHSHVAGRRSANAYRLDAYLRLIEDHGDATEQEEILGEEQRINEAILLGLRMIEGLDIEDFIAQCGVEAYNARRSGITDLITAGLLEQNEHRLHLTRKGLAVADTVCMELMGETAAFSESANQRINPTLNGIIYDRKNTRRRALRREIGGT